MSPLPTPACTLVPPSPSNRIHAADNLANSTEHPSANSVPFAGSNGHEPGRFETSMKRLTSSLRSLAFQSIGVLTWFACLALPSSRVVAQFNIAIDIEAEPFLYSETPPNNRVSRLVQRIESGDTQLKRAGETGFLQSLLEELDIPVSSQVLVFSKTSLQVRYISRRNPRAVYFNDDTYVGWVRGSPIMEISTFDPHLGAAFYTVNSEPLKSRRVSTNAAKTNSGPGAFRLPRIEQETYNCLSCHATSMSQGVPGHVVRSVVPLFDGSIAAQRDSFVTDHTSPLSERWGGWYVTGRHGEATHMGNATLRAGKLDTSSNGNRLSLRDEFDTYDYLSSYSDIVALMVLEHQTQVHNTLVRASMTLRHLEHEMDESPSEESTAELEARVQWLASEVVDGLLYYEEVQLKGPIKGSIIFANEFERRGQADADGRSLRQFDLQTRMFKYPCSYLINSEPFRALPNRIKAAVGKRLATALGGKLADRYPNLDKQKANAIREIITATNPGWLSESED